MRYLILLVALLVAAPSWAATGLKSCTFSAVTGETPLAGSSTNATINNLDFYCWRFVNADGTGTADSGAITINATSAIIYYDPGTGDATAPDVNDAEVKIRHCTTGSKPAANPENVCVDLGGANGVASLTGLEGPSTTQNMSIRVGPGVYYIDVVTRGCLAGATCQVMIRAEDAQGN